ncbi:adhesion G protein-coupled receptor E1 [Tachysurus ichikawai]
MRSQLELRQQKCIDTRRRWSSMAALLLVIQTSVTASVNCGLGYEQDKYGCEDEDECKDEKPRCGNNSVCYNTVGSYYCQCEPGYKAKLFNFTVERGGSCSDINECEENKSICGPNAVCSNIPGSYHCSCATGFVASNGQEHFNTRQSVTCEDINECVDNKSICGPNAFCSNNNETKRSSEDKTLHAPDADKSSAREQQQFNPTLLTFLLISHWILKIYQ